MEEPAASSVSPLDAVIVESTEALVDFLDSLPDSKGGRRCAVDTEADSLHSFREKLCLIQFSCAGRHAIIDPLKIGDLTPLLQFFESAEIWMHGADFDMSLFKRTFDLVPSTVLDTQTAARLCGFRQFGLAHLVHEIFGVSLSKQSQRANWGRRPLAPAMVEYAINDVRYILALADELLGRLHESKRLAWFQESCVAARASVLHRPPPDAEESWRITGWGNLQAKGLAALRALWHWRNGEAERLDRPPFKVINNEPLLQMAQVFQDGTMPELPPRFPHPPRRRFHQALEAVRKLPPEQWPKRRLPKRGARHPEAEPRFDHLKHHRDRVAQDLDLDGALIASRGTMEEIAHDVVAVAQLMPWQRVLMEPAIEWLARVPAASNGHRPRRERSRQNEGGEVRP